MDHVLERVMNTHTITTNTISALSWNVQDGVGDR